MANFYIADWHYSHRNIIAYDNRPFFDVAEMNQKLIENWNSAVKDTDTVYVLGDMFWCRTDTAIGVLNQLKGKIVLVKGNHDDVTSPDFRSRFAMIRDYMEIEDGADRVVLCHYPIPCFRSHHKNWIHLYGHVHSSFEYNIIQNTSRQIRDLYEKPHLMFNVGAMMPYMNYTPRTLETILHCVSV